jgi:hypothetical protein
MVIYIDLIGKRRVEYLNAKKDVINKEHDSKQYKLVPNHLFSQRFYVLNREPI